MSRSTCVTCGKNVRDFDEGRVGELTRLPDHGCADPRGDDPWNDGKHRYRELGEGWDRVVVQVDGGHP